MNTELFLAALPCVAQLISENRTALVNTVNLRRRRIELGLVRVCFQVWVKEYLIATVDTDIDSYSDFSTDADSDHSAGADTDDDYMDNIVNDFDLVRWQPITVAVAFMIFVAPVLENGARTSL